ncbi:hypothetical protein SDC9_138763 [bioreactor metagenome]|uniref:Uncharacterized protein n=1 Tax=bioreactor metagenome TaxID=1076179 RepID=A0A645DT58_9ZZZZ
MQTLSAVFTSLGLISVAITCVLLLYTIQKQKDRIKNKKLLMTTYLYIKIIVVAACILFYAGDVLGAYKNYVVDGITNTPTILYSVFLRDFKSVFFPGIAIFCVAEHLNRITKKTENQG